MHKGATVFEDGKMEIPAKSNSELNSGADTARIDWINLRYRNSGDFRGKAKINLIPADRNWIQLAQIADFYFFVFVFSSSCHT